MLILSRKIGEVVTIGDNVRVKIVAIQEGQVKLGLDAPNEVKIYRAELYEEIQRENTLAAKVEKHAATQVAKIFGKRGKIRKTQKRVPSRTGRSEES